jgi:hypothetical protein
MKLESYPVRENGGLVQLRMQLAALTIQMEEMTKGKKKNDQVWCIKCRTKGHHKDELPSFMQYLTIGGWYP